MEDLELSEFKGMSTLDGYVILKQKTYNDILDLYSKFIGGDTVDKTNEEEAFEDECWTYYQIPETVRRVQMRVWLETLNDYWFNSFPAEAAEEALEFRRIGQKYYRLIRKYDLTRKKIIRMVESPRSLAMSAKPEKYLNKLQDYAHIINMTEKSSNGAAFCYDYRSLEERVCEQEYLY